LSRLIGICLVVAAIWCAVEVYTQGLDRAFGGVFATSTSEDEGEGRPWAGERAAGAFQRAYDKSGKRVEDQLGE